MGKLATQINASVGDSLPMLTTSYNMERYSTNLQMLLKERVSKHNVNQFQNNKNSKFINY
ncbi:hypothetical protein ACU42Y_19685 [Proteus mirabilis]